MDNPIPQEYLSKATQRGRIETLEYVASDFAYKKEAPYSKSALVYVPFGYDDDDDDTLYNVLFLMHGRGRSEKFLFEWQDGMLCNVLDNMIEHGDIAPLIVVTPTYLKDTDEVLSYTEETRLLRPFASELRHNLLPELTKRFHVYKPATEKDSSEETDMSDENSAADEDVRPADDAADNATDTTTADAAGFCTEESCRITTDDRQTESDSTEEKNKGSVNARDHYAFGGFSFGAVATWYVFLNCLDLIRYYIPMCGDCWAAGIYGGLTKSMQTTERLIRAVQRSGFSSEDFCIQVATGTYDPMHKSVERLVRGMRSRPRMFTPDNLFYHVKHGGKHDYAEVMEYLYQILPWIFV